MDVENILPCYISNKTWQLCHFHYIAEKNLENFCKNSQLVPIKLVQHTRVTSAFNMEIEIILCSYMWPQNSELLFWAWNTHLSWNCAVHLDVIAFLAFYKWHKFWELLHFSHNKLGSMYNTKEIHKFGQQISYGCEVITNRKSCSKSAKFTHLGHTVHTE